MSSVRHSLFSWLASSPSAQSVKPLTLNSKPHIMHTTLCRYPKPCKPRPENSYCIQLLLPAGNGSAPHWVIVQVVSHLGVFRRIRILLIPETPGHLIARQCERHQSLED